MADLQKLIDRVFERLMAFYGSAAIHAKFDGLDMDTVKGVWAESLCNYTPHQIGYALDCLKANNFPPGLPEFIGYCNQGAQVIPSPTKRLEKKPYNPNDPAIVEARERCMETMRTLTIGGTPSRAWAYIAQERHESKEHRLNPEELALVRDCIAIDHGMDDPYRRSA